MNNLKKFQTQAEYSAATLYYPAVSWVVEGDYVYFDKSAPTPTFSGLTAHYNINTVGVYPLFYTGGSGSGSGSGGALPSAMIVDGTEVEVTATYQFDTVGEHIIQYSFADNQIPFTFMYGSVLQNLPHLVGIEIGDAITSIGHNAFESCSGLTSCTIGSGLTSIAFYAFSFCTSLTSIDIPDSVTSISNNAFESCDSLTSCTIGSGVTSIGYDAFKYCTSLTSVTVEATIPPTLGTNVFYNTSNDLIIYVPTASVNAYKSADNWSTYASRIQAIP